MHFINHRCQVNQDQCRCSQHRKHSWTLPRYGFVRKLFKNSRFLWGIHSTQKNQRHELQPVEIRSFDYVKKRAQRSDDSILLRHMDDEVGTGPVEHLMNGFEHMKTSLYLTDVVVLRHEGDTVNFSGLEITKTSRDVEVKTVQTSLNPFESLRVGRLETDSQSW